MPAGARGERADDGAGACRPCGSGGRRGAVAVGSGRHLRRARTAFGARRGGAGAPAAARSGASDRGRSAAAARSAAQGNGGRSGARGSGRSGVSSAARGDSGRSGGRSGSRVDARAAARSSVSARADRTVADRQLVGAVHGARSATRTAAPRSTARTATIPAQRGAPSIERGRATGRAYARREDRLRKLVGGRAPRTAPTAGRAKFVLLVMALLAVGLIVDAVALHRRGRGLLPTPGRPGRRSRAERAERAAAP